MKLLLRKESFGGTLFVPSSGKRFYLNTKEYSELTSTHKLPPDIEKSLGLQNLTNIDLIVVEPDFLPIENFSSPDKVFFELTRRCNLTCIQCLNDSGSELSDELNHSQKVKIISDLAQSGIQEVRFTGGEPLADKSWFEIAKEAKKYGLRVSFGSNGTLITEPVVKLMQSIGVNSVITSLDGLKDTHEAIRGYASWEKTILAISLLKEANIEVRVNFVLMRENIHEVYDLCEFILSKGVPVFLRRFIPSGRGSGSFHQILTQKEYDLLNQSLSPLIHQFGSLIQGHYINESPVLSRIPLPFKRKSCSAVHRGMVVLPNGKLSSCGFLAALGEGEIGDLQKESFLSIWRHLNEPQYVHTFESRVGKFNQSNPGPANGCLALAHAYTTKGEG